MPKSERLTRGAVSKLTGCNLETIRYYEQIGLMPPPPRSAGGHRLYDDTLLRRLKFIRRSRDLGFSLEEIRSLLSLVDGGRYTCAEVKDLTVDHLRSVRSKIGDLKALERTLKEMVSKCVGDEVPDCPVIDALFRDDARVQNPGRPHSPTR